jgi:hypothetical protein
MPPTYPLATVGRYGRKTHAVNVARPGLVLCNAEGPYLYRDDDGGFTDKTERAR